MTPSEWIERLGAEIADNDTFREQTADWPTIRTLVDAGALPREALDYFARSDAA